MAEIRAAGEVMNERPIAAEHIAGPTLESALRAPFRPFSWRMASRRLVQTWLGMTALTKVFRHPAMSRLVGTWALIVAFCGFLFCLADAHAQEDQQKNPYQGELSQLQDMFSQTLPNWKAHRDNLAHGEDPSLNDADWSPIRISDPWENGPVWFRRWVEIPQTMGGYNIRGLRVRLDLRYAVGHLSGACLFQRRTRGDGRCEHDATPSAHREGRTRQEGSGSHRCSPWYRSGAPGARRTPG